VIAPVNYQKLIATMRGVNCYRARVFPCAMQKRRRCGGFTLLELVLVLVILAVLVVQLGFRTPPSSSAFKARGFHDETLAVLRYAQKIAIAQRRVVCVALGSTGVSLSLDTAAVADGSCEAALATPSAVGGIGLSAASSGASVSSFEFHPSGATNLTSALTVSISGGEPIYVAAKTGFVYD
jgi:MSHA pilin protein MshC